LDLQSIRRPQSVELRRLISPTGTSALVYCRPEAAGLLTANRCRFAPFTAISANNACPKSRRNGTISEQVREWAETPFEQWRERTKLKLFDHTRTRKHSE
jgi:hypothetical protein